MNYYERIENELMDLKIHKNVRDYIDNKYELSKYYNVGKLLIEAQGGEKRAKYGNGLIKEYSRKLTEKIGKGYSERNLKYMRKYYLFQKGQPMVAQLTWSHIIILMSLNDENKIKYYMNSIKTHSYSKRELIALIKSNQYDRLDNISKEKIIQHNTLSMTDLIPNPIIINNQNNYDDIKEKILKKLILDDMDNFLKQLGDGFSYIGNEYPIKIGNRYNYIDILLFNYIYNCFVVIELKVTELRKEYIGQIDNYMNYINKNIKTSNHNNTVGVIIVKRDNKYVMDYCSNPNIFSRTFLLK